MSYHSLLKMRRAANEAGRPMPTRIKPDIRGYTASRQASAIDSESTQGASWHRLASERHMVRFRGRPLAIGGPRMAVRRGNVVGSQRNRPSARTSGDLE